MSLSKFNGKVVLSVTNLADVSTPAGAKTKWNATFSFTDLTGKYSGTDVAVGDILALDTSGVDIGTITVYSISSIVSSTAGSFRVVMDYLTTNANPGGAPDVAAAADIPGYVGRRTTVKGLHVLPSPGAQLLPDAFTTILTNNNSDTLDPLSLATGLSGGTAGGVVYQSAVGTTGFTATGTSGQVLTSNGTGAPTWVNQSTLTTTASTTTNLSGGTAGGVPYQSATGTTSYLGAGTAGQILTSGGAGAPTWTTPSSLSVSSASTATNLAGGVAGAIHYQSAVGTTAFSAAGTAGQVLVSGGTGAPTWINQSAVASSTTTNIAGGTAGGVPYQSAVGTTGFSAAGTTGQILTSGGVGAPTWTTPSTLSVSSATTATNLSGAQWAIPYQSALNTTAMLAAGTAGQVLTSNGAAAPSWTSASTLSVSSASTATNIAGGVAGAIHYQSAVGTTAFSAAGTAGQVLVSGGTGAPTWSNASTLSVSSATTATNLNGAQWSIPYQSALNTTSMLAAGTAGQVLTSNGAAAPSWQAVSATTAVTQAYGDNTTNIATTAFVDRLRSSPTSTSTTAVLADRGKTITTAAGVTIPASVFAAGDCFSVYNNSAASITLTSGAGLTLYLVGTATTGNRTLAQRGIATVYYVSATEAVITGGGLT